MMYEHMEGTCGELRYRLLSGDIIRTVNYYTLYHGLIPNTADYFRHALLDDLLPRSLIYS